MSDGGDDRGMGFQPEEAEPDLSQTQQLPRIDEGTQPPQAVEEPITPQPVAAAEAQPAPEAQPAATPPAADEMPKKGSRGGSDVRISKGGLWGFLAIAFLVGIAIGVGVLLWQRSVMLADLNSVQKQLEGAQANATATSQQVEDLTSRLGAAEASVTDLSSQNSKLSSDLAGAEADLVTFRSELPSDTISFDSKSVSPSSVSASGTVTFTAKVKGRADKVQVKIVSAGGTTDTLSMTRGDTSGNVDTWKLTNMKISKLSDSKKTGRYRYYMVATVDTKKTISSSSYFEVK